jgi:hypothetical protein
MARNQGPVTDDEIERAKEEIEDLRGEVRQVLADELGGDPDDYRADRVAADGGE